MCKIFNLILAIAMISVVSPVFSTVDELEKEISQEYSLFNPSPIKGLHNQPCKAVQFVYDLQEKFKIKNSLHLAKKIWAIIYEGTGVGGISQRKATKDERKILMSAVGNINLNSGEFFQTSSTTDENSYIHKKSVYNFWQLSLIHKQSSAGKEVYDFIQNKELFKNFNRAVKAADILFEKAKLCEKSINNKELFLIYNYMYFKFFSNFKNIDVEKFLTLFLKSSHDKQNESPLTTLLTHYISDERKIKVEQWMDYFLINLFPDFQIEVKNNYIKNTLSHHQLPEENLYKKLRIWDICSPYLQDFNEYIDETLEIYRILQNFSENLTDKIIIPFSLEISKCVSLKEYKSLVTKLTEIYLRGENNEYMDFVKNLINRFVAENRSILLGKYLQKDLFNIYSPFFKEGVEGKKYSNQNFEFQQSFQLNIETLYDKMIKIPENKQDLLVLWVNDKKEKVGCFSELLKQIDTLSTKGGLKILDEYKDEINKKYDFYNGTTWA